MTARSGITFVGAGKLARAFLHALSAAGEGPLRLVSRSAARARRVAFRLGGVEPVDSLADAARVSRVVFLAVPDANLAGTAGALAAASRSWRGAVVLHAAGSRGPDALDPLSREGAAVGVLHPFQALGDPERGSDRLRGGRARIEGDRPAVREARRIARAAGLVPIRFRPGPVDLGAYHASASLASNDILALLCLAERTLVASGARPGDARKAVVSIARSTLEQFAVRGVSAATGPVVRGDAGTVAVQIAALSSADPRGAAAHAILGGWLLANAAHLPASSGRRVREALRRGLPARRRV